MGLARALSDQVFRRIHGSTLVYNTCWEDPRCDRSLLELNSKSRVVMLTSAGCNALDYLLDDVVDIHCVDLNPRQNALLDLKRAFFKVSDHPHLFDWFGHGATAEARPYYFDVLRPALGPTYGGAYWDKHWKYFDGRGLRKSFYWHGSSGTVAWMVVSWIEAQPNGKKLIAQMFNARDLDEQRYWYNRLEPIMLNRLVRWFVRRHIVQSMLGVPKSQQYLAAVQYPDGMAGYVRHCLRHVFMQLSLHDNYFWRLYFEGHYAPDCCPNYLKPEFFDILKQRADRISTVHGSLSDFLTKKPGAYTHFVLLDHQDWLAAHHRPALEEEWDLLLENAAPGARFLLRSASPELDFLPEKVGRYIRFDLAAAQAAHAVDRVGTYASTWIGQLV